MLEMMVMLVEAVMKALLYVMMIGRVNGKVSYGSGGETFFGDGYGTVDDV